MISPATSADSLYDILCSYIDRGWPVLPIWGLRPDGKTCACPDGPNFKGENRKKHPHGKHPHKLVPHGLKDATLDKAMLRGWVNSNSRGHWAIRCGMPMPDGRFLVILDRDPRNGGNETLEQIQGHRGALPETVTEESGGGGGHYIFGSKVAVGACKAGPGLDVLGAEKYCVITPSKHESGGSYAWALGLGPDDVDIADAPAWLLEGAEKVEARPAREGEGTARDTILGEAFLLAGKLGPIFPDGVAAVCCPWADEHSDQRGRGSDTSTVILPPAGGSRFGGFKCCHSHCATRNWQDVLKALPPAAVASAQQKYPMLRVAETPPRKVVAEPETPERKNLLDDIRKRLDFVPCKGGNGSKLRADVVNLITMLIYDPRWEGILVWDEFTQILKFTKPPPWHKDDAPKVQKDVWSDEDVTRLDAWLRREWAVEMKPTMIREAVYVVALKQAANPLRAWLESLKWDGTPRLDGWLHRYLGVVDSPYAKLVGTKWMISAVARGFKPGCKADHVLILEGPQGKGKSTALRDLCGDDWFSDTPLVIGNKDAYMGLRGRWVLELAELASLNKSDTDKVKAFFSSPSDYYRPPYGKEMTDVPRSCVFAGSVNQGQYLRDETGNRRFWPVRCGAIDHMGLRNDREQLWAETVVRFKAGETWWPSFDEIRLLEPEQNSREEVDGWTETVAAWVLSEQAKSMLKKGFLTAGEILTGALGADIDRMTREFQTRVGVIMTRGLNWKKIRVLHFGARVYVYEPPQ